MPELTVRLGHRADKAHASGDAVELGCDESIRGENEIGANDARDLLFESVLARELDDLFGLSAIEILGDEGRRGSARAAVVKIVERAIEAQKLDAEAFDRLGLAADNANGSGLTRQAIRSFSSWTRKRPGGIAS